MNFSPGSMSQEYMRGPSPVSLNCRKILITLIVVNEC